MVHSFKGTCTGGSGPNLVYTPEGGVRTHLAGVAVNWIAADANNNGLIDTLDQEAKAHGVTLDELLDAIRYARADGAV
jgi:hypothetical protein